jgi:hypothetical protein
VARAPADRLLRERIRKSRSSQALDLEQYVEDVESSSQGGGQAGSPVEPLVEERLMVVANRLPVTCAKDAAGLWRLQVRARGLGEGQAQEEGLGRRPERLARAAGRRPCRSRAAPAGHGGAGRCRR